MTPDFTNVGFLSPKIEAPSIQELNIDIPTPQELSENINVGNSPSPKKLTQLEELEKAVMSTPKVDLTAIGKKYGVKTVEITPDEQKQVVEGDTINERVKWDNNYEAVKRATQYFWTERLPNTIKKFGTAATGTFLGGLATIPNLIGSSINGIGYLMGKETPTSEFFNLGYDSGVNKELSEMIDKVNNDSRNYKSNWSKENWIQDMIPIWGDGGFQDIVASSGYTVGAIGEALLSGGIATMLSKGTKLAGMAGKISKYLNNPETIDKALKIIKAGNNNGKVAEAIGATGYALGKAVEAAPQLYRAYVGAHVESAFEGLEGAKRFEEDAINEYKKRNFGVSPDDNTLKLIRENAQEVGDLRYKLNLAVLTVPNYLQMGALLKTFPGAEKFSKTIFGNKELGEVYYKGLGDFNVRDIKDIKMNWNLPTKAGKFVEKGVEGAIKYGQKYGKVPLSFSEGGEEAMQYWIDEYTSSLYKGVYLNKESADDAGFHIGGMLNTILEKGATKEAAQAFLMGSLGGGIQQLVNTAYEAATDKNKLANRIASNTVQSAKLQVLSEALFSNKDLESSLTETDRGVLMEMYENALNQGSINGTLGDTYTQALSTLNSLKTQQQILSLGDLDAERLYYNIKDRHLSGILHGVVSSGKQDVFREHLKAIAEATPEQINQLYNIKIEEEARDHVQFAKDTLQRLNQIEGNVKKIDFAFNSSFEKPEDAKDYSDYKQELSHKKFMIDRQRDRLEGLKVPDAVKIKEIWKGEFDSLASQISTLEAIQPDTIGYKEAQKDIKRYKQAEAISQKIKANSEKEIINYGLIADFLNLINNSVEYTSKDAMSLSRKAHDMIAMEDFLSPDSDIIKEYKELYSDEGFPEYKRKKEEYKKKTDEKRSGDVKAAKKAEILASLPDSTNINIQKAVNDAAEELSNISDKLTEGERKAKEEEIRKKLDEVIEQNQPIKEVAAPIVSPPINTAVVETSSTPATKTPIVSGAVIEQVNNFKERTKEQQASIDKINKLIEDGKKAVKVKATDKKPSHYKFLGKLYQRVTNFVGDLFNYTSVDLVTAGKNSLVVGNYYDTFGRGYFNNNDFTIEEFKKALENKEKEDEVKQFTKIDVEAVFEKNKKIFEKIQGYIKTQLKDDNLVFIADEIFLHANFTNTPWDGVAGTLDMVVIDSKGIVHVYDFKTKAENDSRYPVTKHKIETPFSKDKKSDKEKWTNQQTAYSIMLEKTFNYKPNINIVVIPVAYTSDKFTGNYKNEKEIEDFKPLPSDVRLGQTTPFIYELKFDENNKLVQSLKTPPSTTIEGQVGTSNYYVNEGLIFYQNEDGSLRPISNNGRDVLEVIKEDIKRREQEELFNIPDIIKPARGKNVNLKDKDGNWEDKRTVIEATEDVIKFETREDQDYSKFGGKGLQQEYVKKLQTAIEKAKEIIAKYEAELKALETTSHFIEPIKSGESDVVFRDELFEEEQFDEKDLFLSDSSQLTPEEQLRAENMILGSGTPQPQELFKVGNYKVYNNEKSIKGLDNKFFTDVEIVEYNKKLNPLGWNLVINPRKISGGKKLVNVEKITDKSEIVVKEASVGINTTEGEGILSSTSTNDLANNDFQKDVKIYNWKTSNDINLNILERTIPLSLMEANMQLDKLIANKEIEEDCPNNDSDY